MSNVNWDDFTPVESSVSPQQKKQEQTPSQVNWDDFTPTVEPKGRGALGFVRDAGVALAKGIVGVPEAVVGLGDLVTGGQAGKLAESAGIRFKDAKDAIGELSTDQQKAADKEVSDAKGFIPTVGAMLKNPFTIVNAAIESAPSMLAGGVASRGALALAPKMNPILAGAIGEGATAAGQNAEQVRQQDPNGTLAAEQSAILAASGMLTGGISFGTGKLANKLGVGDLQTMLATGRLGAVGENALSTGAGKGFARKAAEGAAVEGVLQELPQSYQEQVGQNLAQGKPWDEGAAAAGAQGMLAGGLMGGVAGSFNGKATSTSNEPSPAPQQPIVESQQESPMLGLPAPTYTVGADGVVTTTADTNAAIQAQLQQQADRQDRINRGEILDVTPIPASEPVLTTPENKPISPIESSVAPVTPKLSEQMGINPNAGSLSSAAAMAVDSGAAQQVANQQAQQQATESAEKQSKRGTQPSLQAGELTSAAQLPALSSSVAEAALPPTESTPVNQPATKPKTTAEQIKSGMEDMAKGYTEGAYQQIADYIEQGKTDRLTYSKPEAVESAKKNENYNIVENENGSVTVVGIKIGDQWVGVGRNSDRNPSNHAQAWDNMTPAERLVVSSTTDIKPVIAKNMSKVAWDKINPDVQQKLSTSLQLQAQTHSQFTPPKDVNDLASQWVEAHNADDKAKRQKLLNYGNQNFDQMQMNNAVNDAMAKNTQAQALLDTAAHEAATSPQNDRPVPTDAQKEAGNYAKGHVRVSGMDISIENPQGSERTGKREDGSTWSHKMSNHYGYIKRTEGADGDHVDVYVGKNPDATHAYVVDQLDQKTGSFDEHKVMLGFNDQDSAVQAYKSNFDKGWKVGPVTSMSTNDFKSWLKNGDTTKPVANLAESTATPVVLPKSLKEGIAQAQEKAKEAKKPLLKTGDKITFNGKFDYAESGDSYVVERVGVNDAKLKSENGSLTIRTDVLKRFMQHTPNIVSIESAIDDTNKSKSVDEKPKSKPIVKENEAAAKTVADKPTNKENLSVGDEVASHTTIKSESGISHSIPNILIDQTHKLSDVVSDLASISSDSQYSDGQREFTLNLLNDIVTISPDVKVRIVRDLDQVDNSMIRSGLKSGGYYDPKTNTAYIYPNAEEWEGNASNLLNHELVHAVTAQALREGGVPKETLDGLDGIRAKIKDYIFNNYDQLSAHILDRLFRATQNNDELLSVALGEHDVNSTLKDNGVVDYADLNQLIDTIKQINIQEGNTTHENESGSVGIGQGDDTQRLSGTESGRSTETQTPDRSNQGSSNDTRADANRKADHGRNEGKQSVDSEKTNQSIQDFGEKIGGARKDQASAGSGRKGTPKSSDSRPAWMRRFEINQIASSSKESEVGRWVISDKRKLDWTGNSKRMQGSFATKEEAEAAIPLVAVAQKHRVVSSRDGEKPSFEIWRDISDRKRVKVVDQVFDTRVEALEYMAKHAEQIIETNTTFGEADLPRPENTVRTGLERRTAPVKDRDFMDTFGFRGVEFGNWNNQTERQELLNDAYDGLMDLADVMGIPPKAISLNGDLGLAFGARGQGLSGARAHYEQGKAVINLTKMNGAGSLAHEWFHALDHYFGRQDGKASAEWVVGKDSTRSLKPAADFGSVAVSSGFRGKSEVRQEVRDAYNNVMQTMFKKAETYVEDTAKVDNFVAGARHDVEQRLASIRNELSEQKDPKYYKRNNKPATAEQLAAFDAIAEQILQGVNLEVELKSVAPVRNVRSVMSGMRWTNDALEQLSTIYKAVRGRNGFNSEQTGTFDRLRANMTRYSARLKMLSEAQSGTEKTKNIPTDFAMNAKELDQGRGTDYWTTPHEMAARAFQGYVEDKIAESGGKSPFLNHAPANVGILTPWGWKRPYPHGEERTAINAAFDKLVDAIDTHETDKGIALFSRNQSQSELATREPLQNVDQVRKTLVDRFGADAVAKLEKDGKLEIVPTHINNDVEGFYLNGKTTLVAGNLAESNVIPTFLHELGGHAGMQGVMKPAVYNELMRNFDAMVKAGNPLAIEAQKRAMVESDPKTQRDELLPYLITVAIKAQNKKSGAYQAIQRLIQRTISAVKAWAFDKYGISMTLTPNDMVALAERMVGEVASTSESNSMDLNNPVKFSRSGVRDIASKATAELNKRFSAPGKLSAWHKTVGTMYNLAERSPAFKPVFEAAQNFIDDVSFYASEAAAFAPKLLPKLEAIKDITKKPISAEDNKAVAKPIFEGTLLWGRDRDGTPVLVDSLAEAASKLGTDRKAEILVATGNLPAALHKAWKALPAETYAKMIDSRYETVFLKAGVVWTDDELKSIFSLNDSQIGLYHEARDALNQSLDSITKADMLRVGGKDVKDMQEQVMSAQSATEASHMLIERLNDIAMTDPDRATSLFQAAQDIKNRVETTVGLQAAGYAPLSRFGKYTVDVVEDGERQYFGLFETMHEANTMAAQLRAEFGDGNVSQGTLSAESYKLFAGITPESLELFGNMLGLESDGDKARDQAFQEYIRLTKNNRSAMKRLIHRKGIAGYSEDVGRVLASFIYSNARQTAGGLHMGDLDEAVQGIPKAQGELTDVAVKLRDYIKNPQEEAQAIRGLLFAQYLGGSIASAMVNMTQPIAVTFPYLSQHGGARNAASQLIKAAKQISGKGTQFEPELVAAMKRAEEDGTLSPQEVHQLMAQARGTGSLKSGDGTRAGNAQALAQNSMTRFSLAWGKLFGAAEQINRRVTFIAAYRIAKEQGMANADEFARHAVKETQFVYSKASKMQWGRGAIGGTLMTFKTYSIAYLELMHRLWNQGEVGSAERRQGRKAAMLMIATLLLLSGAGGLPFADDLNDLIDGLAQIAGYNFSSDQAKQDFLEETFGREAAAFINRGVTGLPGSPLDVSGRLGMGNLLPGTGLLKTKTDGTRDVMELIGPMGDLVKRGFSGTRKIVSGDVVSGVLEASPTAFRNLAKGVDMGATGMYRDQKGYKVLETDNLEAAMKAIGFQPASVAEIQRANFANQGAKAFYNLKAQEIRAQWANGIFLKDPTEVQAARDAITSWNDKNPDQRMIISIASVLKKAKEMNKSKDERIAATAPKAMRAQMREDIAQRRAEALN